MPSPLSVNADCSDLVRRRIARSAELCDNVSMPFSRIAENRIREAMAEDQFENLPGAGQPLNLEQYFSTPEDLRMAYSILKSANCVPAEVELLNEVSRLERAIAKTADATERQSLQRAFTDRQTQLALMLEHTSRRQRYPRGPADRAPPSLGPPQQDP